MIHFSCFHCGVKLKVRDELAGRFARCPTCKEALVVPTPEHEAPKLPAGQIDGAASSLARAGVQGGVTLEPCPSPRQGRQPISELLPGEGQGRQRYVVAEEIARGGMGAVLRAVDCDIRREVAVKYLLDQTEQAKKLRFIEEAQITGQLEHPNIVPIHELGFDAQQRLFFSMKMVRGRSLSQILESLRREPEKAEKEYSLARLLNVFVSVANAVAYAHSRGVVHRDLKPANIMVGDFGEVYVMDWGLAKVLKAPGASGEERPSSLMLASLAGSGSGSSAGRVATSRAADADLTVDGEVLGTPAYMPPEQATGQIQAIDQRSDIYSLGAILYEILALRPPVSREGTYVAVLMRVAEGQVRPPEEGNAARVRAGKIPRELSAVAMKALALRPEDRYQTVEALRRDIELFQEGRSVSAKEDTRWEQFTKLVRRNKGVSIGVAVAVLVLLCSLGVVGKALWETNRAYAAYQQEQEDKAERTRKAVPAFVKVARLAVNNREFDEALSEVSLALDYAPDELDARLLKGQLLVARHEFAEARRELEAYLAKRPPPDKKANPAVLWERKLQDQAVSGLVELCGRKDADEPTTLVAFSNLLERQRVPVLADALLMRYGHNAPEARQAVLESNRKRVEAGWAGAGAGLLIDDAGVMALNLRERKDVVRLDALAGMPLSKLVLGGCSGVADLSALRGMRPTELDLGGTAVRDLSPLAGMPLSMLNLSNCGAVRDLSPLAGMPLVHLSLLRCGAVRDLSPLRGLPLTDLCIQETGVEDLSPLRGLPLKRLDVYRCRATDLSPLRGLPLTSLRIGEIEQIHDFLWLRGMNLSELGIQCQAFSDLSLLKGMPLTQLSLHACHLLQDVSPLKGMRLTWLELSRTRVLDLSVL